MNEDWDNILLEMKKFASVEDITDIILLGDKECQGMGIRRIKIGYDN